MSNIVAVFGYYDDAGNLVAFRPTNSSLLPQALGIGRPVAVTVAASRNFQLGSTGVVSDIGNLLVATSGAWVLTLPTGFGAQLDSIGLHPSGTASFAVQLGASVNLIDGTLTTPAPSAGFTVPAGGYALLVCDSAGNWSRAA